MLVNFDLPTKQILLGNLFLILCSIFYLTWWLVAFKPVGAITGTKSAWLLIPAFIFGVLAVIQIMNGYNRVDSNNFMIPTLLILISGIIIYFILLAVSYIVLNRQVTTELFLIIGWLVLTFLEINALHSLGYFSNIMTIISFIAVLFIAIVSLICYLLYYDLDKVKGYIDGAIPLLLIGITMIILSISTVIKQ